MLFRTGQCAAAKNPMIVRTVRLKFSCFYCQAYLGAEALNITTIWQSKDSEGAALRIGIV